MLLFITTLNLCLWAGIYIRIRQLNNTVYRLEDVFDTYTQSEYYSNENSVNAAYRKKCKSYIEEGYAIVSATQTRTTLSFKGGSVSRVGTHVITMDTIHLN